MAPRLDPQDAGPAVRVVEGDALDQPGQNLPVRRPQLPFVGRLHDVPSAAAVDSSFTNSNRRLCSATAFGASSRPLSGGVRRRKTPWAAARRTTTASSECSDQKYGEGEQGEHDAEDGEHEERSSHVRIISGSSTGSRSRPRPRRRGMATASYQPRASSSFLHDVQTLSDGTGLVFRSPRGKLLSNMTLSRIDQGTRHRQDGSSLRGTFVRS